jgi:uncharacterized spore protein YtfJ
MIGEKIAQAPVTDSRAPTAQSVEQVMGQLVNSARVDVVFGQPIEREGATVIPCAEIAVGLGMGAGTGPVDEHGQPVGSGGGGGGGSRGRPIAVIVMSKNGVRVEPVLDLTKIVLATFTTGGFMLIWLGRLIRTGRSSKKGPSFSRLKKAIES